MKREILLVASGFDNLYRLHLKDDHDSELVLVIRGQTRSDAMRQAVAWHQGHGTTWRVLSLMAI